MTYFCRPSHKLFSSVPRDDCIVLLTVCYKASLKCCQITKKYIYIYYIRQNYDNSIHHSSHMTCNATQLIYADKYIMLQLYSSLQKFVWYIIQRYYLTSTVMVSICTDRYNTHIIFIMKRNICLS